MNLDIVRKTPTAQTEIDVFAGEWAYDLPIPGTKSGSGVGFHHRPEMLDMAIDRFGSLKGMRALELLPHEGEMSYHLDGEVDSNSAIEVRPTSYLKCLIAKNLLRMNNTTFMLGDFVSHLRDADQHYDVCFAIGVFYHLPDPVAFVEHLTKRADRLALRTHYFHPSLITGYGVADHSGLPATSWDFPSAEPELVTVRDRELGLYKHQFESVTGLHETWGHGGVLQYAYMMTIDGILSLLDAYGWELVDEPIDYPQQDRAPMVDLCAARRTRSARNGARPAEHAAPPDPGSRFHAHYDEWTERRIAWMVANHGEDVVRGRTVLDIGGGRGHVAERLLDMGAASVEVVEGRLENIRAGASRPGLTFTHVNLERGLHSAAEAYDVVVNFGIIYHVVNWERMLIESVAKARELVFIETEVIDSESEATRYVLEDQSVYDWALAGVGTRPSEFEVDRLLARIPHSQPSKVLDAALNAEFHRYDWEPQLDGLVENGLRRFWTVKRGPEAGDEAEQRAVDRLLAEAREAKTIDTLIMVRRMQELLEHDSHAAAAPEPVTVTRELLAKLAPLQAALGVRGPASVTDAEGLVLHELIVANGLRTGFEIPTGPAVATAFAGLALQRNRGTQISMDSFVEPQASRDELMNAVAGVMERIEHGDAPPALAFASEQLSALGLDDVVTLSIGISPESVPDAIFARALEYVLIGGDAPEETLTAVAPQLYEKRCAVIFHGNTGDAAITRAVAAAEQTLGSQAIVFPTRYRLTLVGRNLDPGSISAADALLTRSRA
jgi:hypothetical protein